MKAMHQFSFYVIHPWLLLTKLIGKITGKPDLRMEVEDFLPILPASPVIIEAGASRGMDTVKFAKLWPEGRILAFEPEPKAFSVLSEVTQSFPNVERFAVALSTETGTATFHVSSLGDNANSSDASSLLKPKEATSTFNGLEFTKQIEVATITLSEFVKSHEIEHIDFMWLDMQGMEIKCLLASRDILDRVDRIYMEVFNQPLYEGAPLYSEACAIMRSLGFLPVKTFINPVDGDVLFERSTMRS